MRRVSQARFGAVPARAPAGPGVFAAGDFRDGVCEDGCGPVLSLTHGLWRSLVSASVWGTEGRRFKSSQPDQHMQFRDVLMFVITGKDS